MCVRLTTGIPLVAAHGAAAWQFEDDPNGEHLGYSDWILVGRGIPEVLKETGRLLTPATGAPLWTDMPHNLFKALRL